MQARARCLSYLATDGFAHQASRLFVEMFFRFAVRSEARRAQHLRSFVSVVPRGSLAL